MAKTRRKDGPLEVPFVVRGEYISACEVKHDIAGGEGFVTPRLELDRLVGRRRELPVCYETPVAEIIDFLAEVGRRLNFDDNSLLQQAAHETAIVNPLPQRVIENIFREIPFYFSKCALEFELNNTLGGADVIDGWRPVMDSTGRSVAMRAFPPRLAHVLAGNSPGVTASTIARAALCKGYNLLKLPSNDLFTATAILRTMSEIDQANPVTRSFSAVYWRGGDRSIENIIYRPQYFDKVVVWGGEAAVKNVIQYIGPGIELIAFDPKVSISAVGNEIFTSDARIEEAATLAAEDVQLLNQEACAASRFQFVEGSVEEVDRYCAALFAQLGVDRKYGSAIAAPPPEDLRTELAALSQFEPEYKVWGEPDGGGTVVRSTEPVDFHPIGKVVNVIPVRELSQASAFTSPATQTVGVWPPGRKSELRDLLYATGVQRVVNLGMAHQLISGTPHDGFLPLHRFVNWVADEG